MSYPILSRQKAMEYVGARRSGALQDCPPESDTRGGDDDCFDLVIEETLQAVVDRWEGLNPQSIAKGDKDGVAGQLSVVLYEGLRELPGSVLSDGDFWRYCAAFLYNVVEWRMGANCQLTNYGAASDSVRDCLPHDMFQRAYIAHTGGTACGDADPFALAKLSSSDVWRSHVLRVQTGNAPLVAHELLMDVQAGKLKTDLVREVAKRLKRARANVIFEVLDQAQARELIDLESTRAGSRKRTVLQSSSDGTVN
jgi:hypothetical protein